jgi:hypothetical protein
MPGELGGAVSTEVLVQPRVDIRYEVSFYFLGRAFQYALYAPSPDGRWALERYKPDATDLAFAQTFVDWNDIEHGIQRVDACRTADGGCSWSSWRTSTRICRSSYWTPPRATPSSST